MNWFERYGFVGMLFVSMTAIWLFCLFPDTKELFNESNNKVLLENIAWLCGLSFLPFGYIIMTISQLWYYKVKGKSRIHCRYWNDLLDDKKKEILELEKSNNFAEFKKNEEQIEAVLTYYDRFTIDKLEANKFVSSFATKRFDVIAINRGMIQAIFLSFLAALFIGWVILEIRIQWNALFAWIIFFALLLVLLLHFSAITLEGQIFEIGRRKLRNIELSKTNKK